MGVNKNEDLEKLLCGLIPGYAAAESKEDACKAFLEWVPNDVNEELEHMDLEQAYRFITGSRFEELLHHGTTQIAAGTFQSHYKIYALSDEQLRLLVLNPKRYFSGYNIGLKPLLLKLFKNAIQKNKLTESQAFMKSVETYNKLFHKLDKLFEQDQTDFSVKMPPKQSTDFEVLSTMRFKETARLMKKLKRRLQQDLDTQVAEINKKFAFSNVYEVFLEEKSRTVAPDTIKKNYRFAKKLLIYAIGDIDVRKFTKDKATLLKSIIMERPGLRSQGKKLSVTRVNIIVNCYKVFMDWFLAHHDIELSNPFENLTIEENERTQRFERMPFELNELKLILNYQFTRTNEISKSRDAAKWVPKIGYYLGMRLEEICGLLCSEVKEKDGIFCIELQRNRVKTKASCRTIPIHKRLIELGLIDYINSRKRARQRHVFDQRSDTSTSLSEIISKWFNRSILPRLLPDCKENFAKHATKKDFHSFRTTFINQLHKEGCQLEHIQLLVGHVNKTVTINHYTVDSVKLKILRDVVNTIPEV